MEMLQLRYFTESAQNENFAKTAAKYMVPTTSVSASVKRLERELGCPLFDRTGNRILLNANGRRLQEAVSAALGEIDRAVDELRGGLGDGREIAMLVRAVRNLITERIVAYNAQRPNTSFRTVFDMNEREVQKYDVIIDRASSAYEGYERFPLCTLRLRLIAAKDHPLCRKQHTLAELADAPFISWGAHSNMHAVLLAACKEAGFTPKIAVQTNDKACYERLIQSGVGIGLGREQDAHAGVDYTYLDIRDFNAQYTVYCYYKKQAYYGTVKHFVDFLRANT